MNNRKYTPRDTQSGLMPFTEIAKELGVTLQYVSQTYLASMRKIRRRTGAIRELQGLAMRERRTGAVRRRVGQEGWRENA